VAAVEAAGVEAAGVAMEYAPHDLLAVPGGDLTYGR